MNTGARYVGIDVAQAHLDIAVRPSGEVWQVSYDTPGVANLLVQLAELTPTLVVLEATGGLETYLAGELAGAQLPVVVVNPRQVRDFAKALGKLAKTDALGFTTTTGSWAPAGWPHRHPLHLQHSPRYTGGG